MLKKTSIKKLRRQGLKLTQAAMSRSLHIKQVTVQLLYALSQNEGTSLEQLDESFWDIALEYENAAWVEARSKAIVNHVMRQRDEVYQMFIARAQVAIDAMAGDIHSADFRDDLKRLMVKEDEFTDQLFLLRNAMKRDDNRASAQIVHELEVVAALNRILLQMRDLLSMKLENMGFIDQLNPLKGVLNRLQKMSREMAPLDAPEKASSLENLSDGHELRRALSAYHLIQELRQQSTDLAAKVLAHDGYTLELVEGLVEHYTMERMDRIDQVILRIFIYEMRSMENMDINLIYAEAHSLADRFSGAASARFTHGILAAAYTDFITHNS